MRRRVRWRRRRWRTRFTNLWFNTFGTVLSNDELKITADVPGWTAYLSAAEALIRINELGRKRFRIAWSAIASFEIVRFSAILWTHRDVSYANVLTSKRHIAARARI